ncbi:hypothetical protein EZI54_11500 [Marinobacter halodurans]|uniref:DUF1449 family protein n=1 Tax=Marinobacter halodurans TaxID=2528979 RepID=A0ABY1ZJV5_9GAMM|nr:OB-fold-containig protein [Marinobacter halodurans]TBW55445.1 hypothetical protein EZI54_11500 [Marinobacter halodurans]
MEAFLSITFSFPTAIFTVLLIVAVAYWLISMVGLLDIDTVDADVDGSVDLGGLMVTLGLQGVPLPLVLTVLFLVGWLFTYFCDLFLGPVVGDGWPHILFGVIAIPIALVISLLITAVIVRPLRPLFRRAYQRPQQKQLIGTACVILAFNSRKGRGRAEVMRDGAHLILQVRGDARFERRERAVLVEYLPEQKAYWVIPEVDFQTGDAG